MINTTYTISELADEFGVTTRTIRFYEERGYLKPDRLGQRRVYSPADRTRLRLIVRGKRLGLTLEEASDIVAMYQPGGSNLEQLNTLIEKIRERRAILQQQQKEIRAMLKELRVAEDNCLVAIAAR